MACPDSWFSPRKPSPELEPQTRGQVSCDFRKLKAKGDKAHCALLTLPVRPPLKTNQSTSPCLVRTAALQPKLYWHVLSYRELIERKFKKKGKKACGYHVLWRWICSLLMLVMFWYRLHMSKTFPNFNLFWCSQEAQKLKLHFRISCPYTFKNNAATPKLLGHCQVCGEKNQLRQ